jgi:hypothetical protein
MSTPDAVKTYMSSRISSRTAMGILVLFCGTFQQTPRLEEAVKAGVKEAQVIARIVWLDTYVLGDLFETKYLILLMVSLWSCDRCSVFVGVLIRRCISYPVTAIRAISRLHHIKLVPPHLIQETDRAARSSPAQVTKVVNEQ